MKFLSVIFSTWDNIADLLASNREAVDESSTEIQKVTEEILDNMSALMGMDSNGLKRLDGDMKRYMRMNYYPPCSRPDLFLGVSPHSEGGSLTVLLQDNDIS